MISDSEMNVNEKKNSGQFVTDLVEWPFLNLLHEAFLFGCRISASHKNLLSIMSQM